jgi:predicted ATPase
MRLKSLKYSEFQGKLKEWSISDFTLEPINLVVGKNATGKTRTLHLIYSLGKLLSGVLKPSELPTGNYDVLFEHEGRTLRYMIEISDFRVTHESFYDEDTPLLARGADGFGTIFHEKEQKHLDFQTPDTDAAVVSRRDTVQHSFLNPLSAWGTGVRHYSFGDTMGRNTFGLLSEDGPPPDPKNSYEVIGLFRKGSELYPETFRQSIIESMNEMGYEIEDIDTTTVNVKFQNNPSLFAMPSAFAMPIALSVKEKSLKGRIEQHEMSQGMFRTLSVIIHLQYAIKGDHPSCILIDDIGEGLDFERSCQLINFIRRCAKDFYIQMVMSTNDRFIMNNVPLEEWVLLSRDGGSVKVHNFTNSQVAFDNFKFTGLNNFDFLAMDFIHEQSDSFAAALAAED